MLIDGIKFGALVRKYRGIEDKSQQQLAVDAFGDESHKARISEMETGKTRNPHTKTVDALVVALNISASDLKSCSRPEFPAVPDIFLKSIGISRETQTALSWNYTPRKKRADEPWTIQDTWDYQEYLRNASTDIRQMKSRIKEMGSQDIELQTHEIKITSDLDALSLVETPQRVLDLEKRLEARMQKDSKLLAKMKSERALVLALNGELQQSFENFRESLLIISNSRISEAYSERIDITRNILSVSKHFMANSQSLGMEFWRLAASEVLNTIEKLSQSGEHTKLIAQHLSEVVDSLPQKHPKPEELGWLKEVLAFLDNAMVRFIRPNKFSDIQFELLMLRAKVAARADVIEVNQGNKTEPKHDSHFNELLEIASVEAVPDKSKGVIEQQRARHLVQISTRLRGHHKKLAIRKAVDGFRKSYKLFCSSQEEKLMAGAALEAAEASAALFYNEGYEDEEFYNCILFFTRSYEALKDYEDITTVDYERSMRAISKPNHSPEDHLRVHTTYGALRKIRNARENLLSQKAELLRVSKLQRPPQP